MAASSIDNTLTKIDVEMKKTREMADQEEIEYNIKQEQAEFGRDIWPEDSEAYKDNILTNGQLLPESSDLTVYQQYRILFHLRHSLRAKRIIVGQGAYDA